MAYIGRGTPLAYLQYAGPSPTDPNTQIATYTATSTATAATVSFHLVDTTSNTFASTPTANICSGKTYVIAVGSSAAGATQSSAKMLGSPVPVGSINYVLLDPPANLSTTGLSLFFPTSSIITFNAPFSASSDTYVLSPSPNNISVGYTVPLTSPLNNCAVCGCSPGSTCQTTGGCSTLCAAGSACGGSCNGACPTGYSCTLGTNGTYSCISSLNTWWIWIAVAVVVFIFIIFIGFLLVPTSSATNENKTVSKVQVKERYVPSYTIVEGKKYPIPTDSI